MTDPLLSVRGLSTEFVAKSGVVRVVDNVSFDVKAGECLGVVGESGSGKSVTALSIMGLLPKDKARIAAGACLLKGRDLFTMSPAERRALRGGELAMIFQEPMTALNPVFTVGHQIAEVVRLHRGASASAARRRALEMMEIVGIPDPQKRLSNYPHQLSGGMRQRIMIAMALACGPQLLIADEPTTALDVTIQAQILELLRDLGQKLGMAIIMITHDLGVVAEIADRVVVMYAGRIVEAADVGAFFGNPQHPYSQGLMRSIPHIGERRDVLEQIRGTVPNPTAWPSGCRFHPRCDLARDICAQRLPPSWQASSGHMSQCWRHFDYSPQTPTQEAAGG